MSRQPVSRRIFLKGLGVSVALPLLDSINPLRKLGGPSFSIANAFAGEPNRRKHFIACFFPNGVYAPTDWDRPAIDGDWTWNDYGDDHVNTKPGLLRDLYNAHKANFMVVRGVNTYGPDTHLYSLASFLSAHRVYRPALVAQPKLLLAPPSLDQRIVRQLGATGPGASLQVGLPYNPKTDADVDPWASPHQDYANAVSYGFNQNALMGDFLPQTVFKKVFGNGVPTGSPGEPSVVDYYHSRNRSILDVILSERDDLLRKAGKEDAGRISAIFDNIRDIETRLFGANDAARSPASSCSVPDYSAQYKWDENFFLRGFDSVNSYKEPFQLMQKIVVQGMECGVTTAATIMYMPSWAAGDRFNLKDIPFNCHWCSHHHQQNDLRDAHWQFGKMFVDLFHDLLNEIKSKPGLIDQTIAVLGSDHGDGNNHGSRNGPLLVAGQGGDLNLNAGGTVVGDANTLRYRPDVLRELGRFFGLPYQDFGEFDLDAGQGGSIPGAPSFSPGGGFKNMGIYRG